MHLSVDTQGNPLQEDESKELHLEFQFRTDQMATFECH